MLPCELKIVVWLEPSAFITLSFLVPPSTVYAISGLGGGPGGAASTASCAASPGPEGAPCSAEHPAKSPLKATLARNGNHVGLSWWIMALTLLSLRHSGWPNT